MRIVIVGDGKMGRSVAGLAEAGGHTIHAMIGATENAGGRALTAERLKGADVAVEFTQHTAEEMFRNGSWGQVWSAAESLNGQSTPTSR